MVERTTSYYVRKGTIPTDEEIKEYYEDMMEEQFNTISCNCKNKIRYTDHWEEGCRFNDDVEIQCHKCEKIHKVNINGIILDIQGGEQYYG